MPKLKNFTQEALSRYHRYTKFYQACIAFKTLSKYCCLVTKTQILAVNFAFT